jgi:hypothetical protein
MDSGQASSGPPDSGGQSSSSDGGAPAARTDPPFLTTPIADARTAVCLGGGVPPCVPGPQDGDFKVSRDALPPTPPVVDTVMHLEWVALPGTMTFSAAAAGCQQLGGGYRLPWVPELMGLMDHGTAALVPPALGVTADALWTGAAPPVASGPITQHWTVSLLQGGVPRRVAPNTTWAAACVRTWP